jgi:hypothetical protein
VCSECDAGGLAAGGLSPGTQLGEWRPAACWGVPRSTRTERPGRGSGDG